MVIKSLPIKINISKKKSQWLNMNTFRNNHYQLNNKMKSNFCSAMRAILIENKPHMEKIKPPVELVYTIFRRDNRKIDLGNIGAVLDKFASDALVECGLLEDDNVGIIKAPSFSTAKK